MGCILTRWKSVVIKRKKHLRIVDRTKFDWITRVLGVLILPAPGGTREYVVGKASEFASFDVRRFFERCAELEPGWGGGSTVGGAPRYPDGSRSRLAPETVQSLLVEVAG